MSRTYKKPYTGSKRFDKSCRNHGSCDYCVGSRTHSSRRRAPVNDYDPNYMAPDWTYDLLMSNIYLDISIDPKLLAQYQNKHQTILTSYYKLGGKWTESFLVDEEHGSYASIQDAITAASSMIATEPRKAGRLWEFSTFSPNGLESTFELQL